MRIPRPRFAAPTLAALAITTLATPASATDTTLDGPTVPIGAGTAHSYVSVDTDGDPTATGLRLTASALDGLSPNSMQVFTLDLPQAAPATVFDHLTVDWNPHGHGPGAFTRPHFDMHFYMIDEAAVGEITPMRLDFLPRASNLPPAQAMPTGYEPPPGPAALNTVQDMGLHWTPVADAANAPGYEFHHIVQAGSWDGDYIFLEPMMTRDWLLEKHTVEEPVAQPEIYTRPGFHPTTYRATYDASTDEYVVEFGGMTPR